MKKVKIFRDVLGLMIVAAMVFSSASITADTSETPEPQLGILVSSQQYAQINSASSNGDVVWDNGMNYDGLCAAQMDSSIDYSWYSYQADDFHFEKDTDVFDVHWIGGYWNDGPYEFDWCISFYMDDGTGDAPAGDDPYAPSYAGPYCYAWEDIIKEEISPPTYYEMSVNLPEILTFNGCEKYWISIWGVGWFPPQSGWGRHLDSTDPVKLSPAVWASDEFGYPFWTPGIDVLGSDHDMCFQLTAPPVEKDFRYTNVDFTSDPANLGDLLPTSIHGAYGPPLEILHEDFESVMGPVGWTQKAYGGTLGYWGPETYGTDSYEPPGTGDIYAEADSDEHWDLVFDTGFFTPSLNLDGVYEVQIVYDRNFQDYLGDGDFAVNTYSSGTDAANFEEQLFYTTVDDPYGGVADATHVFYPGSYADPSDVYVEFWYSTEGGTYAWKASIDDVTIYTIDEYEFYDVDVVVHEKTGFVKSTNPGQLYGVISITDPVSEVAIRDTFDWEFDVNPAKLGGGVEIIMVDPFGIATILTDEPGVSAVVDNENNVVDIFIDLIEATGDPLPEDWTLMIYIKFKTAMKHEYWETPFDEYFINTAEVYIDDIEMENDPSFIVDAQIYLTGK